MFDDNGLVFDLKEDIEIFNLSPNSLSLDDVDNNINYKYKNITPHYDEIKECIAPRDNTRVVNHFIKKW